ncbi:MAG: hypothetical protein AABY15_00260 [Nanoarchaeota archaeon]
MENIEFGARKFNKNSYDNNDAYAKQKFIDFIVSRGHNVINIDENYEHDVITEKNGLKYYFELEVKRNYPFTSRETYIFDTVSFLGRKLRLHKNHSFYYVIICIETEWAVCCDSDKIFFENYIENLDINTVDRNGKDQMYRVPREECLFFDINKRIK